MKLIGALKPGVGKFWLFLAAAVVWSGVGVYLDFLATIWLRKIDTFSALLFFSSGMVLSGVIYLVMFRRFADQNITRLRAMTGKRICFFAFQRWTSYPLVVVMMSMGIYLRVYSPIPKPYLAILYIGFGTSLFVASLQYYRYLIIERDKGKAP